MMSKKQMLMARLAMTAAACGIDMNRIVTGEIEKSSYSKGSREVQDKKILDAKIKRVKKAMTKAGHSKEDIEEAIRKLSGESQ